MFSHIETWTQAKATNPDHNEDRLFADSDVLVLADGATDKTGIVYGNDKSGGRNLAEIAVSVAARSSQTGYELADEVTEAIQRFYRDNNPEALTDASRRAATTLAVARTIGRELVLTQIGDTNIRVQTTGGRTATFINDKLVDTENAAVRAQIITKELAAFTARTGQQPDIAERDSIIARGRDAILSRLKTQYQLQNSRTDHRYGYGILDGMPIPQTYEDGSATDYVRSYRFALGSIATVELVSDGFYGTFPAASHRADYQRLYHRIHQTDPDKYMTYLSTKPIDDASVVLATLA